MAQYQLYIEFKFDIQLYRLMAKDKNNGVHSNNLIGKRQRNFQGYFQEKGYNLTPNQRSLPKKRTIFPHSKNQKDKEREKKQISSRRLSANKPIRKANKNDSPPNHHGRLQHSGHREYDSPSKDQEEIDFLLANRPKKGKSGVFVEKIIQKVNEKLKKNLLPQSVEILQQALQSQPNSYDLNYLLGVCYLINSSYDEAINAFDNLLRKKPRKNIFLLLSVCYKKIQDFQQTENILDDCLQRYPKYYEAYIYRGKLYIKQKKYKKALVDFEKAISLNSNKQIGYIGKGDCLRLMQKYQQAKSVYTVALHTKANNASILLRRSICNMQLKRYDIAFEDINQLLKFQGQNSQALYFKGLIYNKQKLHNEAIICYEQAIKFNTNKKAVTRSIYEIAKIKIEHRDYYEALYTLERAQFLDIDERVIKRFKIFTDGVTYMMKKNYQEGLKSLDQLVQCDEKPLSNFLKPLLYSTRSYGYMALEKFNEAKNDLDTMERDFCLDFPNLYNKFICQAIIACNSHKYEQALAFFSKAAKAIPQRQEPPFYKALTLICFANKLIPKNMKQKKQQYLQSALKTISKVETQIQNNPSLFIIRGFLHFALNSPDKALKDFDSYIAEASKPTALVPYLYGIVLGSIGKYSEAAEQFSKALLSSDAKQIPQIYLNKAKCLLLCDEINNGFVNLQTYMSHKPSSPDIHIWAGHLLFRIGAYQDAAKAYSNINNIAKNFQVLFYRAKCYLTFKDVISTISNLKMMLDIKYENKIFFDYRMLEGLRECSEEAEIQFSVIKDKMKEAKSKSSQMGGSSFGELFKEQDYQFYKAVMYFYQGKYQFAIKNFKRALDLVEKRIESQSQKNEDLLQFYKLNFTNKTFNYFQINYNIAITEIMSGNTLKGIKIVKMLIQKTSGQVRNQFQLFLNLLSKSIAAQFQPHSNNKEQAEFFPFPFDNRLCSIFPEITLQIITPVKTRLYFCLPYVEKPDIRPGYDDSLLELFDMKRIQVKPEAPWIRRSEQGVIFTDEVMGCDVELSVSSEQPHQNSEQNVEIETGQDQMEGYEENQFDVEERRQNDSDRGVMREDESQQQTRGVQMNPNQLKQFFKLDKKTEEKLAQLKSKEK